MVRCLICKKDFKRITANHLQKHSSTVENYVKAFPEATLFSEEALRAYSEGTKRYFNDNPEESRKRYESRELTPEGRMILSETLKRTKKQKPDRFNNPERNKKISNAKKTFWERMSAEERSEFVKTKIVAAARLNKGEAEYRAELREKGINGYKTLMRAGNAKELNKFEQEMVQTIRNHGYSCITQFEIGKWYYDSYIPEKNLIIEFDGDYWHPKCQEDCTTDRLKKQWNIDRKKEEIALKKGYKIVRIRQSSKHLLAEILKMT